MLDILTKLYRVYFFYSSPAKLVMRRAISLYFRDLPAVDLVIEVGGGNSIMRKYIIEKTNTARYISSDIEPSDHTELICDAQHLSFSDEVADIIVALEVIEHIPSTEDFLSEINRVLQPNAYLILSFPFVFGCHDFQDFYRWTPQGIERQLDLHGMTVMAIKPRGGIFLAIISLLSNYIHSVLQPQQNSWRAKGIYKKIYFGCMTIFMLPITILSWISYGMDVLFDSNSSNPSGYIVIAKKNANSCK